MKSLIQICVFFTLIIAVLALRRCDRKIIKKIRKEGGASIARVLTTAPQDGPFVLRSSVAGDIPSSVECVSSRTFKPKGRKYPVKTTFQLENGTLIENEYIQKDIGRGLVLEYSKKEKMNYKLYFVQLYPPCFYRCSSKGKDKFHSAYCLVPAARLNDTGLSADLQQGMAKLERAGIKTENFNSHNCRKELLKNCYDYD